MPPRQHFWPLDQNQKWPLELALYFLETIFVSCSHFQSPFHTRELKAAVFIHGYALTHPSHQERARWV